MDKARNGADFATEEPANTHMAWAKDHEIDDAHTGFPRTSRSRQPQQSLLQLSAEPSPPTFLLDRRRPEIAPKGWLVPGKPDHGGAHSDNKLEDECEDSEVRRNIGSAKADGRESASRAAGVATEEMSLVWGRGRSVAALDVPM